MLNPHDCLPTRESYPILQITKRAERLIFSKPIWLHVVGSGFELRNFQGESYVRLPAREAVVR